jgi:hypothetical protein
MDSAALAAGIKTYLTAVPKTPIITPDSMIKNAAWMSLTSPSPVEAHDSELVAPEIAAAAEKKVFGK